MKLTEDNYYTKENNYLSASKLKLFMKSKELFKKQYIDGEKREETNALIVGNAVDTYVTEGKEAFENRYVQVKRRSKIKQEGVIELTPAMYEQVLAISESVLRQPIMKWRKEFKSQIILQHDRPIGSFDGLCGRVDWINPKPNKQGIGFIDDLKTARAVHPKKYAWHCEDYGYFFSMAMYRRLARLTYPNVEKWVCRHIVVEKDKSTNYPVELFILDDRRLDIEDERIDKVLLEVAKTKRYEDPFVTWDKAHTIGYNNTPYEKQQTSSNNRHRDKSKKISLPSA